MTDRFRSLPLGRLFGIPIRASWAVVAVSVVGWWLVATRLVPRLEPDIPFRWRAALAIGGVLAFLGSILAHEFGHALAARRHGISTSSIRLWILGGVAALSDSPRSPRAEFQIAAAGPAVNILLTALFVTVARINEVAGLPSAISTIAVGLAVLNALLAITNLIPAAPLDGGKVLSSLLWARTGRQEWARLISARVGLVAGIVVIAWGLAELLVWDRITGLYTAAIGSFVLVAARADVSAASIRSRLGQTSVSDILSWYPAAVPDSMILSDVARHYGTTSISLPVQRWAHETIGYLTTGAVAEVPVHDRSWTSVGQVMTPVSLMPSAWTNESLLSALERVGQQPQLLGVDPETGAIVGTATPSNFAHLMDRPLFWGSADLPRSTEPTHGSAVEQTDRRPG